MMRQRTALKKHVPHPLVGHLMVSFVCLASSLALAQEPAQPAPESAQPVRATSVLVLMPTGEDVPESSRRTVTNLISVELQNMGYDVITEADVQKAVELEAEKAQAGCADDSCLAELAGALGAEKVIFGDVGTLGSTMVFTFNLYSSEEARSTSRSSLKVKSLDEVVDKLPPTIARLMGAKAPAPTPVAESQTATEATTTSTEAGAKSSETPTEVAEASPPAAKAEGASSMAWAWWTMAGVGGGVFVVGAAYDFVTPFSADKMLMPEDFLGPVVCATGLVLVGTGVTLALLDVGGE